MSLLYVGSLQERNQDATIYVGGLDEKVNEAILWELFVQAGPVVSANMPKDRVTNNHQGFGFVEFLSEEDADYAIKIMNMIKLYGKPIKVNKASQSEKSMDIGANLFVGNLDTSIDEKLLYDTFSAFGGILQVPKIMRDVETGNSKGFAFISYDSFEAADLAIESMNGQHLANRQIQVSYAFKKDSKGERHGSAAERLLASKNPISKTTKPHQQFAEGPNQQVPPVHQQMIQPGIQPTMGFYNYYGITGQQTIIPPIPPRFNTQWNMGIPQPPHLAGMIPPPPQGLNPGMIPPPVVAASLIPPPPPSLGATMIPPPPPFMSTEMPPPPPM
uniref:Splicing factor 3B subunit 4 n=1 Tax=Parastrongyloides trichosuri TaxID=131310 RepID=A0A0N4ZXL1_PARTI